MKMKKKLGDWIEKKTFKDQRKIQKLSHLTVKMSDDVVFCSIIFYYVLILLVCVYCKQQQCLKNYITITKK